MKFGSLFTGIGGFDLGFERAGMECVWQVEIDKYCQKILKRHWAQVLKFNDVTKLPDDLPEVDLICGGFPCQDLSLAGKRKGLKGEQSGLFFTFISILSRLHPQWVVIENVPGLFSSDEGRDFRIVLHQLDECGYGLAWRVCNSQYWGVAQRRRRVFIVGYFGGPCPKEVLFEQESCEGDSKAQRKTRKEVANSLTTRTTRSNPEETYIIGALDASEGNKWGSNQWIDQGHAIICPTLRASRAGTQYATSGSDDADFCIVSASLDSDRVRKVAGFPGRLDTPDGPRYRSLGNAVTVSVAEWIGKRILSVELTETLTKEREKMTEADKHKGHKVHLQRATQHMQEFAAGEQVFWCKDCQESFRAKGLDAHFTKEPFIFNAVE